METRIMFLIILLLLIWLVLSPNGQKKLADFLAYMNKK